MPDHHQPYTREGVDPQLIAPGLDDPAPLAAIDETGLIDAAAEEAFDRFTRLASRLLGHSGAIMLESGPDEGTIFRAELPVELTGSSSEAGNKGQVTGA